jgi:trypsin
MFKFIIFSRFLVLSLGKSNRMFKELQMCISIFQSAAGRISPEGTDGRIVGGELADIKNLPYQASIQLNFYRNFYHICGGSILNENTIISAAHCFYP